MSLLILRFIFLLVTAGVGIFIVKTGGIAGEENVEMNLQSFFFLLVMAFGAICLDMAFPKKRSSGSARFISGF